MVVVFISLNWIFVLMNYNYHDSLQAHFMEGIGHDKDVVLISQKKKMPAIIFGKRTDVFGKKKKRSPNKFKKTQIPLE